MNWKRYLLWFAHEHVHFRKAEMDSLLKMFNISIRYVTPPCETQPYWITEFESEHDLELLASRSISIKSCIELWSTAHNIENLHENLKKSPKNDTDGWITYQKEGVSNDICPFKLIEPWTDEDKSFKIEVETFCKHYSMVEKIEKIEEFNYLPICGPVKLKKPDAHLMFIEYYGTEPNDIPNTPYSVFFGRWLFDGQRDLIQKLSLKTRKFIGNTSMDPQLSLLMANQALVKSNALVLDPFAGSGSLLVAAAEFGGYVWGSDIDFMMLHGRTKPTRVKQKERCKEESIKANLKQYGSFDKYMDVLVSDFSLPLWRDDFHFDAIITDPPYGVREPTERIGIEREGYTLSEKQLSNHIPAKVNYGLEEIFKDLLEFSAKHLKIGGRLVCWYPVIRSDYDPTSLPSHPCLEIIADSEQTISKLTSRRLLTFEKRSTFQNGGFVSEHKQTSSFREKFFALTESTRKERKERAAVKLKDILLHRGKKI